MSVAELGPVEVGFHAVSAACMTHVWRQASIRGKLSERFEPKVLEVLNESYMHNVPKGTAFLFCFNPSLTTTLCQDRRATSRWWSSRMPLTG